MSLAGYRPDSYTLQQYFVTIMSCHYKDMVAMDLYLILLDCLSLLSMGLINSLGACLRLTELLMMDTDTTQTGN